MAQDEVLEREVFAGTTEISQDAKQHREEAQHRRGSISGQGAPRSGRSEIDFCRPSAGHTQAESTRPLYSLPRPINSPVC